MQIQRTAQLALRQITTSAADMEFFCRRCRGHYSKTVDLSRITDATCRCGSGDLLVYQLTSEGAAPLIERRR